MTKCVDNKSFREGSVTTKFIEDNESELLNSASRFDSFAKSAAFAFASLCIQNMNSKDVMAILCFIL